jgi:hypothetical protein
VNRQTCLRPKSLGGLGIKDIENFGKTLRLRWLWHKWDPKERQWRKLLKSHDASKNALFFCFTYMHVGNGLITPFWEAKWLHGATPKELAPELYKKTRFKNRSVASELKNRSWIKSLGAINSSKLLQDYIMLYMVLESIQLSDQPDEVFWRWTANGRFSVASAYNCQFKAAYTFFPAENVWKTYTEPKCRFFA